MPGTDLTLPGVGTGTEGAATTTSRSLAKHRPTRLLSGPGLIRIAGSNCSSMRSTRRSSVIHADKFTNVPHFIGKHTVERMIESLDIPATILRPAYFMQNERMVQQVIQGYGVYPMPIGSAGVAMIDARDIADIAVAELLRRDSAATALPSVTLDLVGPELITGASAANTWGSALAREVTY